jgi:GAF domain-containing protein
VATSRDVQIAHAVVSLADTIRADFDVSDLLYGLTRYCVELLNVETAGLLLADEDGQMQTVASAHPGSSCSNCSRHSTTRARASTLIAPASMCLPPTWRTPRSVGPSPSAEPAPKACSSVHAVPLKLARPFVGDERDHDLEQQGRVHEPGDERGAGEDERDHQAARHHPPPWARVSCGFAACSRSQFADDDPMP